MSVPTSQAAPALAAKETSNPAPDSVESTEMIPSAATESTSIPKPAIAPVVFVRRVSPAPTVLVVSPSQAVTQTPSTAISETVATTQLILKPAASPVSMPQDVPSPDSSTVDGVGTVQEKVELLVFVLYTSFILCGINNVIKMSKLEIR